MTTAKTHIHRSRIQVDPQLHRLLIQPRFIPRGVVQYQVPVIISRHGERFGANEAEGVGVFRAWDEPGGEIGPVRIDVGGVESGESVELRRGKACGGSGGVGSARERLGAETIQVDVRMGW